MLNPSIRLPWFPTVIVATIAVFGSICFLMPLSLSIVFSLVFLVSALVAGKLREDNSENDVIWCGIAVAVILASIMIMVFPSQSGYIMYVFPAVIFGTVVGIM